MTATAVPDIVVQALGAALLDGVEDGEHRRRIDLAVVPCFEDERPLQGLAALVDWRSNGALSNLVRSGFFCARTGETMLWPGRRTLPMERVVMLGLGPVASFDREAAQATGRAIVQLVTRMDPRDVLVAMPGQVPERSVVESVFDGLLDALRQHHAPHADAQVAALAVGDEASGPVAVESHGRGHEEDGAEANRPTSPRAALEVAPQPGANEAPTGEPAANRNSAANASEGVATRASGADRGSEISGGDGGGPADSEGVRWWVVADPRHEARLRRLLEGPPRAAKA